MSYVSAHEQVGQTDYGSDLPKVEQFEQILKEEPLNAGLRVDLILAFCQEGKRSEALGVFEDLQAIGNLPAGIRKLLTQLFSQGCTEATGMTTSAFSVSALQEDQPAFIESTSTLGWASNVNAAPKPKGIALGEAGALGFYTFAPSSRPKSSGFAEFGFDYFTAAPMFDVLSLGNPSLSLSASARGYLSASDFNTIYVAGQLAWLFEGKEGNQSLQLQLSHWQLGGRGYETSWGVSYERPSRPLSDLLGRGAGGFWGINLEQTQVLQDGRFDANRLGVYVGASYALPARGELSDWGWGGALWAWSVGPVYEESVFHRPGGHRLGLKANSFLKLINPMGQARVRLSAAVLNDQDVYNQTLLGRVKRERRQIELSVRQELRPFLSLRPFMGLSWATTKDSIDLFTVESFQLHLGISEEW